MDKLLGLTKQQYFFAFAGLSILALLACFVFDSIYALALPIAVIGLGIAILDIRYLYVLLIIALPFSMNPVEQGGISIDLPTEPILIALTAFAPFLAMQNRVFFNRTFFKNPLIVILIVWLLWMCITCLTSTHPDLSIKFVLAKIWYIIPFVGITALVTFNNHTLWEVIFKTFLIIASGIIIIVLLKHKSLGFAFDVVSEASYPFFRNHVIYGSFVSLVFPVVAVVCSKQKLFSANWYILFFTALLFLVAIYFSFSRGAWAAVFISLLCYVAVRLKVMQYAVVLAFALITTAVMYLSTNNKYIDYAPKYETGIMHENLADHLLATIKGKDISSNERFYRWVAAARMCKAKPIMGYGPNTFYYNYKAYTITLFRTYVSRNDEHSTTHNYFLFTLVEQGIPGMLLYALLVFILFSYGQKIYYHAQNNKFLQTIVLAILCMEASFLLSNFLSELVEVDKLGGLFFVGIGILIGVDFYYKELEKGNNMGK
jgi:O-antigen ligase